MKSHKKILLVSPPFCTPASPPYSVTNIASFLENNSQGAFTVEILDLNILFHKIKFPSHFEYAKNSEQWDDYDKVMNEFKKESSKTYSVNNKAVVSGKKPELFEEMIGHILSKNAGIVAFSVVYSSQVFYCLTLIQELKKRGITTIVGGPCVNERLVNSADYSLNNEVELLAFLLNCENNEVDHDSLNFRTIPDFSIYDADSYFVPDLVVPIKSSTTCFYKKCTFCSHYSKSPYYEFSLDVVKETIEQSKQKYFFFIDDMIPSKRLLKIASVLKDLNVTWSCQLKPTRDFTSDVLKELYRSGLKMIIWGVESGNDRILQLMKKGTHVRDVSEVLKASHNAGISNVVYIMFGFPTETKEEFLSTIQFLQDHSKYIDLVSPSIFGLQKGTPVYENSKEFGITRVMEEKRTVLEPKITYEVASGLSSKEASTLKEKYKRTLEGINKFPKFMNFFREHMICVL